MILTFVKNGLKVKFRRIDGNWEDETNSQLTENNLLFLEESPYWDVIRSKDIK